MAQKPERIEAELEEKGIISLSPHPFDKPSG